MKVKLFPYHPVVSRAGADAESNVLLFRNHVQHTETELNLFLESVNVRHVILLPDDMISIWYEGQETTGQTGFVM